MSLLTGMWPLAMPIGSLASKFILEQGGHLGVFCSTLGLYSVAILYVVFFIKDSRGKGSDNHKHESADTKTADEESLSVLKHLYRAFSVTFKPRTGYKRACLAILLGMRCISIFSDCKKIFWKLKKKLQIKINFSFRSFWNDLPLLEKDVWMGCHRARPLYGRFLLLSCFWYTFLIY